MITNSFIYWFTRLDHIHSFLDGFDVFSSCLIIFSIIVFVIAWGIKQYACDNEEKLMALTVKKFAIWTFCIAGIFNIMICTCLVFIPTTKEMAAIYVIPKIVNNEKLNNIGNEMLNLANEWMKELHPTTNSSNK